MRIKMEMEINLGQLREKLFFSLFFCWFATTKKRKFFFLLLCSYMPFYFEDQKMNKKNFI